jgi:hypothetical protein
MSCCCKLKKCLCKLAGKRFTLFHDFNEKEYF